MLKKIISAGAVVVIGSMGYLGYQEYVKADPDQAATTEVHKKGAIEEKVAAESTKKNENTEATKQENNDSLQVVKKDNNSSENYKKVSLSDAKSILQTNLNSIFKVFIDSGEQHLWNSTTNPVDYSLISPKLKPYATQGFIDSTLKDLSENYYQESDKGEKPNIDYNVRFSYEQKGTDKLEISALEHVYEVENVLYRWNFTLVKEDEKWKMSDWDASILDYQDLKLTGKEAEQLATQNGETATLVREFNSKEAGGKAYLLKLTDGDTERMVAVSSINAHYLLNFKDEAGISSDDTANNDETKESRSDKNVQVENDSSKTDNEKTTEDKNVWGSTEEATPTASSTLGTFNIMNSYDLNMHFSKSKEDMISEFGKPVSETDNGDSIELKYPDATYAVNKSRNEVTKVVVIGSKAASFYKDFDSAENSYNFDDEYAGYDVERTSDAQGYHLILSNYSSTHTYTSQNESGNPVTSITVEMNQ